MTVADDFDVAAFKADMARVTQVIQDGIPGAYVTLVIRFPTHDEGFLVAGGDDLDAVADVIRRARDQTRRT
jgi:hypothetical protein